MSNSINSLNGARMNLSLNSSSTTLSSMYLRFKRKHQTIFLHCEPGELLKDVVTRLAEIQGVPVSSIRCYEHMTQEKLRTVIANLAEKEKDSNRIKRNNNDKSNAKMDKAKELAALASSFNSSANTPAPKTNQQLSELELRVPPLDFDKKLWELNLQNDAIILFVLKKNVNNSNYLKSLQSEVDKVENENSNTNDGSNNSNGGGTGASVVVLSSPGSGGSTESAEVQWEEIDVQGLPEK